MATPTQEQLAALSLAATNLNSAVLALNDADAEADSADNVAQEAAVARDAAYTVFNHALANLLVARDELTAAVLAVTGEPTV